MGSEPGTSIVLFASGDRSATTLRGERRVLEQLAGLEVAVRGRPTPDGTFEVESVAVRAANGVPAVDGTLAREGERYLLILADGRRLPLAHLPAALRGREGARVWLAGPLDRNPDAFGMIEEPGTPR